MYSVYKTLLYFQHCSNKDGKASLDMVTHSLAIIMLLWKNGANPLISYKLGEKNVFPANVENDCPIISLLFSKCLLFTKRVSISVWVSLVCIHEW